MARSPTITGHHSGISSQSLCCRVDSQVWCTLYYNYRLFKSALWKHLMQLLGSQRIRTTAYHPIANGMIERFHRQLKAVIKCKHQPGRWTEALPLILLGIRSTFTEDLGCTAAELVYGSTLRLPGEFVSSTTHSDPSSTADYVSCFRQTMADLRPPTMRPQHRTSYVHKALATCSLEETRSKPLHKRTIQGRTKR